MSLTELKQKSPALELKLASTVYIQAIYLCTVQVSTANGGGNDGGGYGGGDNDGDEGGDDDGNDGIVS